MNAHDTNRKYRTLDAVRFLAMHGEHVSRSALHVYRTRAPKLKGELGPDYLLDPVTGTYWYRASDLLKWIDERNARLVKRAHASQPAHLAEAKA